MILGGNGISCVGEEDVGKSRGEGGMNENKECKGINIWLFYNVAKYFCTNLKYSNIPLKLFP